MNANREKRRIQRVIVRFLLIFLSIVLCSAANAGAQAEIVQDSSRNAGESAATKAREQLELALVGEDTIQRFPALQAARFINEPWLAELALPLCQSPDALERAFALEVVTSTNPAIGREAFLEALTSEERPLRLRGLLGLAALGSPETIPELVRIMNDDPYPDLQATAARALGDIGDIAASNPLYGAIGNNYPPVREQAVLALIAIGDHNLGKNLVDRLRNDHSPGIAETLRLMALVPDPDLISFIEPYLTDDDPLKRTLAAAAILSILERSEDSQS